MRSFNQKKPLSFLWLTGWQHARCWMSLQHTTPHPVVLEPINIWHCPSHHLQINLIAYFDFLPDDAGLTPHIDFVMLADVTLRNIFQPANVCIFSPLWTLQIKLSRVCSFCDEKQNNLAMPLFNAFKRNSYGRSCLIKCKCWTCTIPQHCVLNNSWLNATWNLFWHWWAGKIFCQIKFVYIGWGMCTCVCCLQHTHKIILRRPLPTRRCYHPWEHLCTACSIVC